MPLPVNDETLTKRARLLEIDRLVAHDKEQVRRIDDQITALRARRSPFFSDIRDMKKERLYLMRELAKESTE